MAKKSNALSNIPSEKLEKLDKIIQYAIGEVEFLPPALEREYLVIFVVEKQLRLARSPEQIQKILEREHGPGSFSRATVYRYIAYAKYVYGTGTPIDKQYEISRLQHWSDWAIRKAMEAKDFWFMEKHLLARAKFLQLDKADADLVEKYTPHTYIMNIHNHNGGKETKVDYSKLHLMPADQRRQLVETININALPATFDEAVNLSSPIPDEGLEQDGSGT